MARKLHSQRNRPTAKMVGNDTSSCDGICWLQRSLLLCTALSIPFYILILVVLAKYRKSDLNSQFFTFCLSAGVADIWYSAQKLTLAYIPKLFFKEQLIGNEILATITKMGHWGIYYAQVFGVVLITLNRFSALVVPLKHEKLWSPKNAAILLVLQWLISGIIIVPMFLPPYRSRYDRDIEPVMIDQNAQQIYWTFSTILESFILAPTLVVAYTVMVVYVAKRKHRVAASVNTNRKQKTEVKLAINGLIISVLYVILCVLYLLAFLQMLEPWMDYIYYVTSDCFTLSNPYILVCFSSKVRRCLRRFMGCPQQNDQGTSANNRSQPQAPKPRTDSLPARRIHYRVSPDTTGRLPTNHNTQESCM